MFTTLHELAKKATLMITIAAEGDGQLRVNVTPMPFDTKAKHNLPQPLSLLATPVEFDADFVAALSTWQAPKRSLIQQAQDAAGATPALPAPEAETKNDSKSEKPGRKARAGKGGEDDKKVDAVPEAAAAAGEAAAAADQVMATSAGEPNTSADANAARDQGAQPIASGDAGDGSADAPASAGSPGEQVASADKAAPAPEEVTGDEPVDKFTLDLF